jgi:hypothetical protein
MRIDLKNLDRDRRGKRNQVEGLYHSLYALMLPHLT